MAEYTRLQNNFSAGYVDPTLHGLTTSSIYGSGLKRCLNFLPSSMGYLYRRPGTRSLGIHFDNIAKCRIHAIKADVGTRLVLIREGRIDFYTMDNGENPKVFHTIYNGLDNYIPWLSSDIDSLDIYEFEGCLYIVHGDYPPCVVTNIDSSLYTITYETVKVSTYSVTGVEARDLSLSDLFAPDGFECQQISFVSGGIETFSSAKHYPSCQTFKGGRWYLSGLKDGPNTIYASKSPDARGDYRFNDFGVGSYYLVHVHTQMSKTTIYEESEFDGEIKQVTYSSDDSTTEADKRIEVNGLDIDIPESTSSDLFVRYNSSGTEVCRFTDNDQATDTQKANTKKLVVTTTADTWSLKSDMQYDDAIELTECDMYGSRVNWMLTQQRLISGTSRSIWMDNGSAATPSDFDMVKTLGVTTSSVRPVIYGSMIMYVPADLKSVKAFYYDNDSEGYQLIDMSASARSLFRESEITQIALVEGQEPILWVLLANGKLLSCTIGSTYGWAEHEIGGDGVVDSIFPFQAETGIGSLFMVVNRGTRTSVERMVLEDLVNTDVFTLCDSAVVLDPSGGTVDFTSNDELIEDKTVQIVAGGWPRLPFEYEKEEMDIGPGSNAGIYIGYPYKSECTMLWQELPTNASQSSLSFFRKATSMALLLYRSAGAECGWYSGGNKHLDPFQRLVKNKSNNEEPTYADYYTGIVKLSVPSNTSEQVNATVECTQPLPMTIQAIETRYIIQEA